ncbi:MAG: DUF1822 family protein [Oscillatoria sp. PMC 1068.18]|nr:DUF1822 family protein [Oscillatoria sp. PMC 1076.18]MEC4989255.1 DUF1822 family protein [Oscillatoria sp. PMC 1068.18]
MEIRRIEEESENTVNLVIQGSQEQLERIQQVFKSGKLQEILEIPVEIEDVKITKPVAPKIEPSVVLNELALKSEKTLVNLSNWLHNVAEAGWQTVEEILGQQRTALVFATRDVTSDRRIILAEKVNFETPTASEPLALVVDVMPESEIETSISLQLHPTGDRTFLPPGIKYAVVDTSGQPVKQIQTKANDQWIRLDINGKPGEKFGVQIASNDQTETRNFVI